MSDYQESKQPIDAFIAINITFKCHAFANIGAFFLFLFLSFCFFFFCKTKSPPRDVVGWLARPNDPFGLCRRELYS